MLDTNIEMFYLVDELFKHKNKTFSITIGHAIDYEMFDKSTNHTQIAQSIKKHVYELALNSNSIFVSKTNFDKNNL